LIETIQRIPRYKLLLQGQYKDELTCLLVILLVTDYLKHLPADSEDRFDSESKIMCCLRIFISYLKFIEALELISRVAAHVNESIRQVDNFRKLIDVQKRLVGETGDSLISPSRVS